MEFEKALNIISGTAIDYYYEEFGDFAEDDEECASKIDNLIAAETALSILIQRLKSMGITNLKELREFKKRGVEK